MITSPIGSCEIRVARACRVEGWGGGGPSRAKPVTTAEGYDGGSRLEFVRDVDPAGGNELDLVPRHPVRSARRAGLTRNPSGRQAAE